MNRNPRLGHQEPGLLSEMASGHTLVELRKDRREPLQKHFYLVAALISFLLCFGEITDGQTPRLDSQAIIKKMIAQYERMSSYQDSGVVRVISSDPTFAADSGDPYLKAMSFLDKPLVSFKTHFTRPSLFRFEWKSTFLGSARTAAIWSDGKQAYSWTPNRARKNGGFILFNGASLSFYISEATGSSGGAVFFVPNLLMKDASPFPTAIVFSSMTDLSLLGEKQFEGETCYVIKGKISGVPWILWIGRESYLLRKTNTSYTTGSFHDMIESGIRKTVIAEEIHRDIKINQKIPLRVFTGRPRLKSNDIDLTR